MYLNFPEYIIWRIFIMNIIIFIQIFFFGLPLFFLNDSLTILSELYFSSLIFNKLSIDLSKKNLFLSSSNSLSNEWMEGINVINGNSFPKELYEREIPSIRLIFSLNVSEELFVKEKSFCFESFVFRCQIGENSNVVLFILIFLYFKNLFKHVIFDNKDSDY